MMENGLFILSSEKVRKVYKILLRYYGPQGWWPLRSRKIDFGKNIDSTLGFNSGGYHPGINHELSSGDVFEVVAGAILTQNTNWNNAASAIDQLILHNLISIEKIKNISQNELALLIKSCGYYNQKAAVLKNTAEKIGNNPAPSREDLISVTGIGPETADSIMLYAFKKPYFVVDAYTRRIFSRIFDINVINSIGYETLRAEFEKVFCSNLYEIQECHALLVIHAKKFCQKTAKCNGCPVRRLCKKIK